VRDTTEPPLHECRIVRINSRECRSRYCPAASWPQTLARAKGWVPQGHAAASLLYVYDGHYSPELFDETFRSWGPATVGYGASHVVFGPAFGRERREEGWPRSLALVAAAMGRAKRCNGRAPLLVFKAPAFNFDPFNSLAQQRAFAAAMRPLVARHPGMLFLDNFDATFRAAFQAPHALKFATGSTFHYLDAGRHLMAQHLLHLLWLVSGAGRADAGETVVHERDGSVSVA
jgi:hypothetical protein